MNQLRGFKFAKTLVLVFEKIEGKDKTKYDNFYSSSKVEVIINESDIENVFKTTYTTIIANIQIYLGKGLEWIIDSVNDYKYNPLAGSSFIKLPKESDNP